MRTFAYGVLCGVALVFGGLSAAYAALAFFRPESLPAPALSALVHLDEKLRFLRNHPDLDPAIIAVGSSITWRQLDGTAFEPIAGGEGRFSNGATANLKINQTRFLTKFYLHYYSNVQTVLVMTSLPDFDDCSPSSSAVVNQEDAANYAFNDWPAPYFYLRYFSPQRYVRTALSLASRRTPYRGDLSLDSYGSSPLEVSTDRQRGLRYGLIAPDQSCVDDLVQMSHDLTAEAVQLVIVFSPVHPEYQSRFPDSSRWIRAVAQHIEAATATDETLVIDLHDQANYPARDFYDAFHLQWPAVKRLSLEIAAIMRNQTMGKGKGAGEKLARPLTVDDIAH